jgi:hypothetical protein
MTHCSRRRQLLVAFAALALLAPLRPRSLFAQTSGGTRILVCESAGNTCSQPNASLDIVWTLNGTTGTATSPSNPAGSRLTIEKFDSDTLVIQRVDDSGPTSGLSATYSGTVHGTQIAGTVQYSWPGHPDYPSTGTFSAVLQDQVAVQPAAASESASTSTSPSLPSELLVCENHGACNAAWILNGSTGTGTWFARNPVKANLTVDRADSDYIRIRRTDTTDGVSAVYAGSPHGNQYSGHGPQRFRRPPAIRKPILNRQTTCASVSMR